MEIMPGVTIENDVAWIILLALIMMVIAGMSKKASPKRDRTRYFSNSQKEIILKKQHWRCAECGCRLRHSYTQFDHKKPWSRGGRTTVSNGQALCANCHSTKSRYEHSRGWK